MTASARALLTAERTALNLLGHLSGIATVTRDVVARLEGLKTRVVVHAQDDARACARSRSTPCAWAAAAPTATASTTPSSSRTTTWRSPGGSPRPSCGCGKSVGHLVKVEVEVDTLAQLDEALALGVDAVLLDNMDLETLREAVRRARGRALTEASGGIRPENVREVAETGVDLISLGWLTHSAPSLDVALDVEA